MKYSKYEGQYANDLTNHLPMALRALDQLGADENCLTSYAKGYIEYKKVAPLKMDLFVIDKTNWQKNLGLKKYEDAYREFFSKEYDFLGREKFIKTYLNHFSRGFGSAAFHGLIRIAYAIRFDNDNEVINAFSYMAIVYKPYNFEGYQTSSVHDILEVLVSSHHFKNKKYQGNNISERMFEAFNDIKSVILLRKLPKDQLNLKVIKETVIELLCQTESFTVLHAVTASHALSNVFEYISNKEDVLSDFWLLIQLAYLSTNCVEAKTYEPEPVMTFDEVKEKVLSSYDAHVIKLVYSCYEEYQLTHNNKYHYIASVVAKRNKI